MDYNGTEVGDYATFTCDEGYIRTGDENATCLSSQEWTEYNVSCIPIGKWYQCSTSLHFNCSSDRNGTNYLMKVIQFMAKTIILHVTMGIYVVYTRIQDAFLYFGDQCEHKQCVICTHRYVTSLFFVL